MDKHYQVFVSSTYRDLQAERREVMQVLLEMDCVPAAMELFPAADEDQWTLIKNVIDDCDYYIVIVGGRYGSLTVDGISYTEKEYDYAVEQGKPVLGFVHEDPDGIPARNTESEPAVRQLLSRFRDKVRSRPIRTYATPEQLGSIVSRSLMQAMKKAPAEGWIRGRFARSPEHDEEVSRLRAEVAELRLEKERSQSSIDVSADLFDRDELAQSGDSVDLHYRVSTRDSAGIDHEGDLKAVGYTWEQLFRWIGPELTVAFPEASVHEILSRYILQQIRSTIAERWPEVKLEATTLSMIMHQFRALGYTELVENSEHRRLWRLTPVGDRYLLGLLAVRRTSKDSQAAHPS